MHVGIAWLGPAGATLRELDVDPGSTVADVLRRAGQDPAFSGAGLETAVVGVFGRVVSREQVLEDGDRVEIYRGPAVDAKQARRQRVARSRR